MNNAKYLKTGLIIVLIVTAGVLYSCQSAKDSKVLVSLADQTTEERFTEEESTWKTEDAATVGEVTGQSDGRSGESGLTESENHQKQSKNTVETQDSIYVYICGAVKKPDVYETAPGTRLVEVIKLAGGLTQDAAGEYVNQAAMVADGEQIYIPAKDEVKGTSPESSSVIISKSDEDTVKTNSSSGKVNINKASQEELMTLPGIGEAKSADIIAYRQEHGGFKSIEEIKNISGIKNSVFNKISDRINVE